MSEAITQFVAAAESNEKDVPPEAVVNVAGVAEVSKGAFVAAVCAAPAVSSACLGWHRRWAVGTLVGCMWFGLSKTCRAHVALCKPKQVRDAIKAGALQPAMLEEEEDAAQGFFTLLAVTTARHHKALAPILARAAQLAEGGGGGEAAAALQKMAAGVATAGPGDAKFRAYVGLLLGLINFAAKVRWRVSIAN